MSRFIEYLDKLLYPKYRNNWDDQLFRERILGYIEAQKTPLKILDLGAGVGIVSQMNFKGLVECVCGVDPDQKVKINPYLDEAKVGSGEHIPYPDEHFNIIFTCNVLEHLELPEMVFAEVYRTLKSGGFFLVKTPNRWHYVPLIANMTTHGFHEYFNSKRHRQSHDTFPTRYRANTRSDIWHLARTIGFKIVSIDSIEGRPEYMRFSFITYIVGWIYEKTVNLIPLLSHFRILLIAEMRKPNNK